MWNSLRDENQTKERGVKTSAQDVGGEQERTEGRRVRRSNKEPDLRQSWLSNYSIP